MNDNEAEVKLAAVNNISECLEHISTEKIGNLILPTLINTYGESTPTYKAGAADALCNMSVFLGAEISASKIIPNLDEMLKETDNSEVKMNVIMGVKKVAVVVGTDFFTATVKTSLLNLTKDNNWRVQMVCFEEIANLGLHFGQDAFNKYLEATFFEYLTKTAASVRNMGIKMSK